EAYPSHIYTEPGYYSVCLSIIDATGSTSTYCDSSTYLFRMSEESTMITINVTDGTTETEIDQTLQSNLTIGPNPFNDQLHIHISTNENDPQSGEFTICNLTGISLINTQLNAG